MEKTIVSLKEFVENTQEWHDVSAVKQFLDGNLSKPVMDRIPRHHVVDITLEELDPHFSRTLDIHNKKRDESIFFAKKCGHCNTVLS